MIFDWFKKEVYCQIHWCKASIKNGHFYNKWMWVITNGFITNDYYNEFIHDLTIAYTSEINVSLQLYMVYPSPLQCW